MWFSVQWEQYFLPNKEGKDKKICLTRNVPMGGVGHPTPPIFSNLQESWSEFSQAARGPATVFSVTFFIFSKNSWSVGQHTPPQQKVSWHITESNSSFLRFWWMYTFILLVCTAPISLPEHFAPREIQRFKSSSCFPHDLLSPKQLDTDKIYWWCHEIKVFPKGACYCMWVSA